MTKLKPLFDAAREADAKVLQILTEMTTAFESGTEEGKQQALDLRPALDEAKLAAEEANLLYISARDAEGNSDPDAAARKFVPVPGAAKGKDVKELSRAEFEALNAADRMSFMLADGKITD